MVIALVYIGTLIIPAIILGAKGITIFWVGGFALLGIVELMMIYKMAWWTIAVALVGVPISLGITIMLLEMFGMKVFGKKGESITNEVRGLVKKPENTWKS